MVSQIIKGKYEPILGFVTLVISLSAFKDELSKVTVNLEFTSFTLANYFLWIVYAFSFCLYLYIIEHMVRDTAVGSWKIFDWLTRIGFFIFIAALSSPVLISLIRMSVILFGIISVPLSHIIKTINIDKAKIPYLDYFSVLISVIAGALSATLSEKLYKLFKISKQETAEKEEIVALDIARKLFKDDYFSQSLLEAYKALSLHLYRKLLEKNITISPSRADELFRISLREGLINQQDQSLIADMRGIRNATAHTNIGTTEVFARRAIDYVGELINRNG